MSSKLYKGTIIIAALCAKASTTTVIPYARSGMVHGTPLHFSVCTDFLQSAFYRLALAATFVLVHTFWTLCALSAFEGLPVQTKLSGEKSCKQRRKENNSFHVIRRSTVTSCHICTGVGEKAYTTIPNFSMFTAKPRIQYWISILICD